MALDATETRIRDRLRLDAPSMLARLGDMVAVPSGCGHRPGLERMRQLLVARLERLGAAITLMPAQPRPSWVDPLPGRDAMQPLVVAKAPGARQGPRLLLCGHIDTVHDPTGAFQRLEPRGDGAMTGPGAADMKGGLEVMLSALEAIESEGVHLPWTVVLVPDEETGTFGTSAALRQVAAEHDRAFVVEPATAAGDLVSERAGSGQFCIEAHGRAAHAGRDFASGVSAVRELAVTVAQACSLADVAQGRVLNVGPLQGGAATNIVPDLARAWGNIRFRDEDDGASLMRAIEALAHGGDRDVPRVRIRIELNRPAKPANPGVRAMGEAAVQVAADLGFCVGLAATGGVSDANLIQQAGPPALDGLGVRGGNLHRTDEFMWPDSLAERAGLLAILLARQ